MTTADGLLLRAGTGRVDITPPPGIAHLNWGARTHDVAEGVHLPLWLTVLLLEQGSTRVAIADLDLGGMSAAEASELREVIGEAAGTPPGNVRVSYTHTHSGPPWTPDGTWMYPDAPGMQLVAPYRRSIVQVAARAAREAAAALRPARTAAGYGESAVTVNRRLPLPDGRVVVAQNPDGFTDRTVTVVRIDDHDERPIATILGYGTHPIIFAHENRLVSPDYPGVAKRVFEQLVGGTCVFLQGCTGDQMPVEAFTADPAVPGRIGTRLAVDAVRVALGLRTRRVRPVLDRVVESGAPLGIWVEQPEPNALSPLLAVAGTTARLPLRTYEDAATLKAEAAARAAELRDLDRSKAGPAALAALNYKVKRTAMNARWAALAGGRDVLEVEVQGIRIGDAALVGVPLEPFAQAGVEVREGAPLPVVQLGGYSNGWFGYVPTADAYPLGGYEVEWATPFTADASSTLVREVRDVLARLAAVQA